jgi:hypothetical protein
MEVIIESKVVYQKRAFTTSSSVVLGFKLEASRLLGRCSTI